MLNERQPILRPRFSPGFTLIELMITVAVMGIISVGFVTMLMDTNKQVKNTTSTLDNQLTLGGLVSLLSNPTRCSTAVQDMGGTPLVAGEVGNGKLSPLVATPQSFRILDPLNAGGLYFRQGSLVPGSRDWQVTELTATAVAPFGTPTFSRDLVPGSTTVYNYCWRQQAQYRVQLSQTNVAIAQGRATGTPETTRQFVLTARQSYAAAGACAADTFPAAPPSPPIPAPTAASAGLWQVDSCSMGTSGYTIQGIGQCIWCPIQTGNAAPAAFNDPLSNDEACSIYPRCNAAGTDCTVGELDPNLLTPSPTQLAGSSKTQGWSDYFGIPRAEALPELDGGTDGTGDGGVPPSPPPASITGPYGALAPKIISCGRGYYQAGSQHFITGGGTVSAGCNGKYCTPAVTSATPMLYTNILCCKVLVN